jgi:hypothetical protein
MTAKEVFAAKLMQLVNELKSHVSTEDGQWTVKGIINIKEENRNSVVEALVVNFQVEAAEIASQKSEQMMLLAS